MKLVSKASASMTIYVDVDWVGVGIEEADSLEEVVKWWEKRERVLWKARASWEEGREGQH